MSAPNADSDLIRTMNLRLVCPACGADPDTPVRLDDDSSIAAALEDGEGFGRHRSP